MEFRETPSYIMNFGWGGHFAVTEHADGWELVSIRAGCKGPQDVRSLKVSADRDELHNLAMRLMSGTMTVADLG